MTPSEITLKLIQKAISDHGTHLDNPDPQGHYLLEKLLQYLDWDQTPELEALLCSIIEYNQNNHPITDHILKIATIIATTTIFSYLLSRRPISDPLKLTLLFLALEHSKFDIADIIKKSGLDLNLEIEATTILREMIRHSHPAAVKWLLANGAHESLDRIMDDAKSTFNLNLIQVILEHHQTDEEVAIHLFLNPILHEMKTSKQTALTQCAYLIDTLFVNSSLAALDNFIAIVHRKIKPDRDNAKLLSTLTESRAHIDIWGPLIVRFQPKYRKEIADTYHVLDTAQSYAENQKAFAYTFNTCIKKTIDELKKSPASIPFDTYVNAWMTKRAEYAQQLGDQTSFYQDYSTRACSSEIVTPIRPNGLDSRYDFVIPILKKYYKMAKEAATDGADHAGIKLFGPFETLLGFNFNYRLTYTLKTERKKTETIDLTTVYVLDFWDNICWNHCPRIHPGIIQRLNDLDLEIRSCTIEAFYDLVAEAYWLGCNSMLTYRGNSYYMLMWLKLVHDWRGLKTPIVKPGIMLDCYALSVPLDEFMRSFLTYFER